MDISTRTRREATSREDQTTSLSIAQIRITRTRVRRKEKGKSKTRHTGEAHLGIEWDSSDESTDDEDVATIAMEARTTKSSLFGELTDDEDDFTHTCFMAKEAKVYSSSSPDSDDGTDDSELENMIKELGPKATNKIMKLMVEIEGRDEILETQEELLKLEREKTVGLEKSLSKERKSFKVQEDLLNAKIGKLLELL